MNTKSNLRKWSGIQLNERRAKATGMMLLALLLLLMLPSVVQAQQVYTNNYGPWYYTTTNDIITITGYTGANGDVTIPDRIPDTTNGLPVTSIGDWTFWNCSSLTSITIPNSVTSIGDGAFCRCSNLRSVTIPNSVTNIGDYAFLDCYSLTAITVNAGNPAYSSVDGVLFDKSQTTLVEYPEGIAGSYSIPDSVTSIGDYAFAECWRLTSVTIGDGVTSIGGWAFTDCTSLTAITVDTNNPAYCSVDGVLFDKSQTTLIVYPEGKAGAYAIPTNVTNIGDNAFYGCTSLTSVTIPNSVTNIGDYAFYECYNLTTVTIGTSVTSIGDWAFSRTGLTSVTIPNSVISIGDSAFYQCISLTNLTIGSSVTNIGDYAFSGCFSLTSVTIPNSVTNIGVDAFGDCTSLTGITVEALNSAYISVDGVLFDKSQTTLIQYPPGQTGTSYTIPSSITTIGDDAFYSCGSLTNIMIGNGVTNIGDNAFYGCSSLTSVYFQGNAPSLGADVFDYWSSNNGSLPGFQVSDPATIYYLPGTTGWSDFSANTGLPTVLWTPQVQTSDAGFGVRTNQFGFTINWASGMTVVVEASTSLVNPTWSPISTNTLTSGSSYFSDPQWTNYPGRFYRFRWQ